MSVAQMNYLSVLFYFMAGIFGALAAILYVAFDIRYISKALRKNSFYRLKANPRRKERIEATEKLNRNQQKPQKQNKYLKTLPLQEQGEDFPRESSTIPLELANLTYPIKNSTVPLEKKIHLPSESYTIPLELAHNTYAMENSTTPLQESALLLESTPMNLIQNIVYIDSNEAIPL